MLLGQLAQEAAGRVCGGRTVHATGGGVGEVESTLGTCDGDVGEATLLLERIALALLGMVGEEALLHAGDEDDRELQALGRVDGHERHGTCGASEAVEVGAQGEPLHEGWQLLGGDARVGRRFRRGGLRGRRSIGTVSRVRQRRRSGSGYPGHKRRQRLRLDRTGSLELGKRLQGLRHVVVRLVELGGDAKELADVLDAAVALDRVLRLERLDKAGLVHDHLDDVG